MSTDERRLTLVEHLVELRRRLIRSLLALAGGMALSIVFSQKIFEILQRPLKDLLPSGSSFIATSPLEALFTYLKVSLLAGLFLASPIIFWQVWRFVAPGLSTRESKWAWRFVFLSTGFFVGGGLFGYLVIFPIGFRFFLKALEGTEIVLLPQMQSYLSFASRLLIGFGLVFELPVVLTLLGLAGIVSHNQLARARRYVILAAFLIAGIATPGPDVLSQLLLAVPLLALYELSLLVIWIVKRKEKGTFYFFGLFRGGPRIKK